MAESNGSPPVDPDEEKEEIVVPTQPVHVFLLAGQSNMAGRGVLADDATTREAPALDDRIFVWKDGAWAAPAHHPLHSDKDTAGVGPGLSFAREIIQALPAAERCVGLASVEASAAADARLSGVLWHQGESGADDAASAYPDALARVARSLPERACCDAADFVPVMIVGELGVNFLDAKRFPHARAVNDAICKAPGVLDQEGRLVSVCSALGLSHLGDNLHFDALSAEILGRRYAHAWLLTEGLAPPDLHDFALAPGFLNDEVDRPWYSRFFGMITCAT
ncbi:carbohydrate esterase/sialic acid-specific acetylesterase [Aureococcus anophagefferens]|nr:carbohydrate esterase/sialic acid-specific acetylesterase [Aureococcus anophagefferens]